jgi:type I restriction enzyme S subunit
MDALVAEQERLIALLKEKRQAVISHAVTKGLDPNAPMKDSGIPWLGQVPAHWDTTRLKSDLAFLTSGSRGWAQYYADDGPIFLRIGNLTRDSLNLDFSDTERVTVPDGVEGERTRVAPGDVLFSITAFIGSVAVVPEGLGPAFVSQHVALARLHGERLDPRWVGYVVLSDAGKAYLDAQCYGGTKIQLSLDDVANLPLPLPPPTEQRRIVQAIEARLAALGALATEAERAITLLKERRAALISASVTGKIDVRGLAAPAETEATAA